MVLWLLRLKLRTLQHAKLLHIFERASSNKKCFRLFFKYHFFSGGQAKKDLRNQIENIVKIHRDWHRIRKNAKLHFNELWMDKNSTDKRVYCGFLALLEQQWCCVKLCVHSITLQAMMMIKAFLNNQHDSTCTTPPPPGPVLFSLEQTQWQCEAVM